MLRAVVLVQEMDAFFSQIMYCRETETGRRRNYSLFQSLPWKRGLKVGKEAMQNEILQRGALVRDPIEKGLY
jgi:hypothetical protein